MKNGIYKERNIRHDSNSPSLSQVAKMAWICSEQSKNQSVKERRNYFDGKSNQLC